MNLTDELERLHRLHQEGALSAEEFAQAKSNLLSGQPAAGPQSAPGYAPPGAVPPVPAPLDPARMERETRQWAFFLHLSVLAGFVVPIAGFVAPIVIWQLKKDDLPGIDAHGKNVVNWLISKLIYVVVSVVLLLAVIGFVLLPVVLVLGIVFPIMGAVKANNGEVWKYPLAIRFLQ